MIATAGAKTVFQNDQREGPKMTERESGFHNAFALSLTLNMAAVNDAILDGLPARTFPLNYFEICEFVRKV